MKSESVPSGWSALLALQRATHATLHVLSAELVDLDLTASEINALANLADGRGRTVRTRRGRRHPPHHADQRAGPPGTTRPHHPRHRPGDRRAVLIELTSSGQRAATTIRQAIADLEHRALDGLPPDAVAGLRAALQALTEVPS